MRRAALSVAFAATTVLGACATTAGSGAPVESAGPGAAATKPALSVHTMPLPTGNAQVLPALNGRAIKGLVSVLWSLQKLDRAGRAVYVVVELGGCRTVRGSQVTYSSDAVTIAVLATPEPTGLCTLESLALLALVPLPEAVGDRKIEHAPVSAAS
jgi:hypothetical protein